MSCPHDNRLTLSGTDTDVIARFEGSLSAKAMPSFFALLARLGGPAPPARITLDLSGAATFDPTGLDVLRALAEKAGRTLRVQGATPEIVTALRAAGLDALLDHGP